MVVLTGWKWVKLGDVCKDDRRTIKPDDPTAQELPYLGLEHIESGSGNILDNFEISTNADIKSNSFFFDNRHILYGKLRPYLNKVVSASFSGKCSTELIPLLPIDIVKNYLLWILRGSNSLDFAVKSSSGTRMPRTDMNRFMAMPIPLPPLEEQKRISERIIKIENSINSQKESLSKLQELQSSLLQKAFRGEL